jgi:hypothetical protein
VPSPDSQLEGEALTLEEAVAEALADEPSDEPDDTPLAVVVSRCRIWRTVSWLTPCCRAA